MGHGVNKDVWLLCYGLSTSLFNFIAHLSWHLDLRGPSDCFHKLESFLWVSWRATLQRQFGEMCRNGVGDGGGGTSSQGSGCKLPQEVGFHSPSTAMAGTENMGPMWPMWFISGGSR